MKNIFDGLEHWGQPMVSSLHDTHLYELHSTQIVALVYVMLFFSTGVAWQAQDALQSEVARLQS